MSETHFQNTETALKNQQASIQGLETQIGELTLRVGDDTITLQARNSGITSNIEGNSPHQSTKTDNMTLQKLSFKEVHEPCSRNDRGHIHEERRLQIEKLDEWRAHKSRTHDNPKLRQNEPDTSPNQLKVGDKVLLDAADPHIVTTTPNKEIPLTILSIFPFDTMEVSHPKFCTFKACLRPCENRAKDFPNTGYDKTPRPCDMVMVEPTKTTQHQTEWHRKGVISIGLYVTRLARHFELLNTATQESSLTLIGQMSPQAISSMLSMRMIATRRGTYPPQYRLAQFSEEEAYEDIPDDVPPHTRGPTDSATTTLSSSSCSGFIC
ncbi:hypothetical protein GOBAR_AA05369 [Gossypium barbadense]|uniref:Uncharacterized protein n=1 Tax=Gossypium barbadense TaxID=3634 RepID=A0A2P5YI05_GOSBA|nr:hypothetical protein GOBAR_AA05369 [Gossypium barbadense]